MCSIVVGHEKSWNLLSVNWKIVVASYAWNPDLKGHEGWIMEVIAKEHLG